MNTIYKLKGKQYISKFILCCIFIFILFGYSYGIKKDLDLVELGNKYYIEHNYDEALKIYEEALKKNYKYFEIYHNLGSIYYYEKKDFKKAEEIFKNGLLIYPNEDILHYALSQLYFDMDTLSEAVKEYKSAVKLARGRLLTINANKAKELLKHQGKDDKEIYEFFSGIIKFNPKDTTALYEAAEYDQKEKRFEVALEKYKKILKVNPRMKEHLALEMGICYYNLKDYKTALGYFEKAKKSGNLVSEVFINKAKENIATQNQENE